MLFKFLLVVQALVGAAMIGVILMQKSEGGGLGVGGGGGGGGPQGLMSARGAADFLTRSTGILATVFVGLSILLAALASMDRSASVIDDSLVNVPPASSGSDNPIGVPLGDAPAAATDDPLGNAANAVAQDDVQAPSQGSGVPIE